LRFSGNPVIQNTKVWRRDSDEVGYALSGEITFKIDEEVTVGGPGTCAFIPRGMPHAWKNTGAETSRVLFLYTPAGAGGFFEERMGRPTLSVTGVEANELRRLRLGDHRSVAFLA
jgi:Cupin domain